MKNYRITVNGVAYDVAVEELGAGEVVGGVVDVYTTVKEGRNIPFEPEKYNRLLGTDIAPETMLDYFKMLDLGYEIGRAHV